jgi:hypothetical protein
MVFRNPSKYRGFGFSYLKIPENFL